MKSKSYPSRSAPVWKFSCELVGANCLCRKRGERRRGMHPASLGIAATKFSQERIMLTISGQSARTCEGLSRREWLRVGGLSGLSLPALWQSQAAASMSKPRARAVGRNADRLAGRVRPNSHD